MKRFLYLAFLAFLSSGLAGLARADEKEAQAIIDKGIKALGGEEKLSKAVAYSWKSKGTITINGSDNEFSMQSILEGIDHYRSETDGKFNDMDLKIVTVLSGDKGWMKFNENVMETDADGIINEKHRINIQAVPTTLVQLKGKGFKIESAAEEKVGDKPAAVIKVTGPEGKNFKLYFDKESGLPVKLVATVAGFGGQEDFTQETTLSDYQDFDGIKKATKVSSKRDGEKFVDVVVSDFKVLDKVPADTFTEPK
jgi:hypothetical protein